MASLLGGLVYAGQQTLLTTQASLGSINAVANLFSINGGQAATLPPDVALFQPGFLAQGTAALGAGIGFGGCTLPPLLYTRTGSVAVFYNPNTTALPGEVLLPYFHSRMR
jgi:hypothetical protein